MYLLSTLVKLYLQESLANAKVNARQHCVSLSCLCNSLTQIEWVADFSLGDEDSENIVSERYENRHLRRPLSCLTPHISRTPANIWITLTSLSPDYISAADSMGPTPLHLQGGPLSHSAKAT